MYNIFNTVHVQYVQYVQYGYPSEERTLYEYSQSLDGIVADMTKINFVCFR